MTKLWPPSIPCYLEPLAFCKYAWLQNLVSTAHSVPLPGSGMVPYPPGLGSLKTETLN